MNHVFEWKAFIVSWTEAQMLYACGDSCIEIETGFAQGHRNSFIHFFHIRFIWYFLHFFIFARLFRLWYVLVIANWNVLVCFLILMKIYYFRCKVGQADETKQKI